MFLFFFLSLSIITMRIRQRRRRLKRWAVRSLRKTRQRGGFLPALAPLIALASPYIASAGTAAAGALSGWVTTKLLHGIDNRRPKAERIKLRQSRRVSRRK